MRKEGSIRKFEAGCVRKEEIEGVYIVENEFVFSYQASRHFQSFLLHYINRYVSVLLPRNAVDTEMYTFGVFVGGGVRKMHFLFL